MYTYWQVLENILRPDFPTCGFDFVKVSSEKKKQIKERKRYIFVKLYKIVSNVPQNTGGALLFLSDITENNSLLWQLIKY